MAEKYHFSAIQLSNIKYKNIQHSPTAFKYNFFLRKIFSPGNESKDKKNGLITSSERGYKKVTTE